MISSGTVLMAAGEAPGAGNAITAPLAPMGRSRAVVLGVGDYVHAPPLPAGVRRGAEELAELLRDPDLGGYPPGQVRLLIDREVTLEALREELSVLARVAEADSTVVVYFAGHGGDAGEAGGGVHLLPAAADPSRPGRLAETALGGRELADLLGRIDCRHLLAVFDCCHSGGLGPGAIPARRMGPVAGGAECARLTPLPPEYCESLAAPGGRVVLSASRQDEFSWLREEDGRSVFTSHLLAAFRGAGDGGVTRVWDLFEYLQPRVTGERPDQHPILRADLEENFTVARAVGAAPAEEPPGAGGFRYDAYLSHADREPDATWVWQTLVPRLEAAGLRVAVAGDVEEPGVSRVVSAERGIVRARRTVVVLSEAYLVDRMAGFIDTLAQTLGLEEGTARLVPVLRSPVEAGHLPARLRMLVGIDLTHPRRASRNFHRLVRALHAPLPPSSTRGSGTVP